jgi:hypothetical protein
VEASVSGMLSGIWVDVMGESLSWFGGLVED